MTGLDAIRELADLAKRLRETEIAIAREARDRRDAGIEDSRLDSLYRWAGQASVMATHAEDMSQFCRDLDTNDVGTYGLAAIRKLQANAQDKVLCYVAWAIPATQS